MASDQSFVDFITDQLKAVRGAEFKKMFGEYAIYSQGKVVALICDNQLFVKPTAAGKTYIGEVTEAPAYPGAKNSYLIEDKIEDASWLCELIRITAKALPALKPKKPKKKK